MIHHRLLVTIFTLLVVAPSSGQPLKVVIDPGHGGSDPGATRFGSREADVALQVSQKLHRLLDKDPRFEPLLTRERDLKMGLRQRSSFANNEEGDLFLSIHANASMDQRAHGVEFYFQNQLAASEEAYFLASREDPDFDKRSPAKTPTTESSFDENLKGDVSAIVQDLSRSHRIQQSHVLVQKLHAHWQGKTRKRRRSVRQAPFFLVSNVNMPSALIELGYMSHPREVNYLLEKKSQQKMAESIYQGIIHFSKTLE